MELRRYWSLLRRRSWLIILFIFIFGSGAFTVNILTTPIYQASTTLLINLAPTSSTSPDYNSVLTSQNLAKTYKELLRKQPVLDKVIQNLKLKTSAEQLAKNVTVDIVRDTQLLVLSVEDPNPQQAALIANAIADEFSVQNQQIQESRYASTKQSLQTELDKIQADITKTQATLDTLKSPATPEQTAEQSRLQTALTQYRSSYATLLKSFEDVHLAEVQATSNLTVVEAARTATKVRPNTLTSTILAIVVGFLLAVSLVFFLEYLDDSVKTTEQIEQLAEVSTLGVVSRIKGSNLPERLVTLTQVSSSNAEAYRVLRANIEFSEVDKPIRTLVITSTNSGEGKTTTTANLAVAIAQSGKRVIVVDADLRRPSLHQYFRLTNIRGLTTVLLEQSGSAADHLVPTSVDNLYLMASGPIPPNPAELLGSRRMLELVEELKTLADVIIFDSSPILPVVDPTLLARLCDATLLVIHSGATRTGALKKAKVQLNQSGTRLLGGVLNQVSTSQRTYYYYYHYTYSSQKNSKQKFPFKLFSKNKSSDDSSKNLIPSIILADRKGATSPSSAMPALAQTQVAVMRDLPSIERSKSVPLEGNSGLNGSSNGHGPEVNGSRSNGHSTHLDTPLSLGNMVEVTVPVAMTSPSKLYGCFIAKEGPCAGQQIELTADRVIIGRLARQKNPKPISSFEEVLGGTSKPPSNQVMLSVLADDQISRRHIGILQVADNAYLYDLGSMNGTWLNGNKLGNQPVLLNEGDELRLGQQTILVYHCAQ